DRLRRQGEDAYWPGDILDLLLAAIGKHQRQLAAHLVAGKLRDAQTARLADRFKASRDIHAVAEDVLTVDNDIADIDADAEDNSLVLLDIAVALDNATLNGDGAGHRVDHAGKIHQQAVARGLDDASAVGGDGGIDQVLAHGLEGTQGADFVDPHQPAIADDIRRQNRGKFALNVLVLSQKQRPSLIF